ncbi:MbnP family protein [Aliiglaciecola litoralis]|uniref:Copper-binding protein MbnP-like domain-containing protein n=1 Tax=Aliiglaciecola litoralis TaxID=582857 RepID=A0ABN1LQE6_9ALTE
MNSRTMVILVVVLTGLMLLIYSQTRPTDNQQLTLRFHPKLGELPLVFDQYRYANPGGDGLFKIRDLQLFVSNLTLVGQDNRFVLPDSYHLLRFDLNEGWFDIDITYPADINVAAIELGIGVDPQANGTIKIAGDLDPNGRMAWSWDVGYKFLLLEGAIKIGEEFSPLVYHVGFDENYQVVQIPLDKKALQSSPAKINFSLDFMALFDQKTPFDMAQTSSVKFDRADAAFLAAGFSELLSLCDGSCD